MSGQNDGQIPSVTGRFTPALLLLFVGSGCSALIYEIVWFHLLRLVIGATTISLAVLLASFMGGMCLGSLAFPRLISCRRHPLRVYACLELGIGVMGLALLYFLPYVNNFYVQSAGYGSLGVMLRAAVGLVCLLPPTILMGATLPAISRWMQTTRTSISKLGFFYGANIVGAVVGTLLAGFFLLRFFDTQVATYVAASINALVVIIALLLAGRGAFKPSFSLAPKGPTRPSYPLVYVAIALSGLTALGAEVLWTRLLSLLFGPTVYTFSIILAVFLTGLGLGSGFGSLLVRLVQRPKIALGCCQLMLVACIPAAAYMITEMIPYWDVKPEHWGNITHKCVHDLIRCLVALGPATFFWGASFPLALAAAASEDQDPGRLTGGIYAANTFGAIAGALLFSLLMVPYKGTQWAQQALAILAAIAALLMFGSHFFSSGPARSSTAKGTPKKRLIPNTIGFLAMVVVLALASLMIFLVPPIPNGLIAYGRIIEKWDLDSEYPYLEEGINASVAVSILSQGITDFHVSGKVVASTDELDMRLQRMLGHLPALIHPQPQSVLVVGCGAGVTAGTFVIHPDVERIVICEIEPLVLDAAEEYFGEENYDVLKDPRTVRIYDDARHFLTTTQEKFDIITSDPIHPWVRGAAALYSAEYFDICKQHLNPGGIVTQWVPFYETSEAAVKSEMATFMQAFPHGTVWNSDISEEGYDVVMLGQVEPMLIDVDAMQIRIENNPPVLESLAEVKLGSAVFLLGTYAGQGPELKDWLSDGQINYDRSLRLQYLAGLALDAFESGDIYQALTKYRSYPENLFIASAETEFELRPLIH